MNRKLTVVLALAAVALFAFSGAFAADAKKAEPKSQSWTGEIIDLGCYMGHGAKGAGHQECALKCISNGMPMGLLTNGNKVYVLTMNHDNADPFNACKTMASQQVKITGTMTTKGGVQTIEVAAAEAAPAPAK
ncbi:MAG TPA: hypothetical protein VFS09_08895 [Candidatus Eisenbacteria bacterium]|nr:hypothetical protein [Candidatus Eisenbacteria bacterium]